MLQNVIAKENIAANTANIPNVWNVPSHHSLYACKADEDAVSLNNAF